MKVALVAEGNQFPAVHVSKVFAAYGIVVEPLEFSHGDHPAVRYRAMIAPDTSLDEVSAQLLNGGTVGIRSVSWEAAKRKH